MSKALHILCTVPIRKPVLGGDVLVAVGKGMKRQLAKLAPAPTGRPTKAQGIALGTESIYLHRALKGRTSSRERPWSHSLKRPFRAHSRIGAAPGRCPGLSSHAPLGLASHTVHPVPATRAYPVDSVLEPRNWKTQSGTMPSTVEHRSSPPSFFQVLDLAADLSNGQI
jgi:hypothetical protein